MCQQHKLRYVCFPSLFLMFLPFLSFLTFLFFLSIIHLTPQEWKVQGIEWKLNPYSSQVFGGNKSTKLLDFIAQQSSYKDADRCTAHGRRALGISMVANANVGPGVLTGLGGHSSLNMVAQ